MKQEEQYLCNQQKPETIESLKEKLAEAERTIEKLRQALGANHPLGTMRRGIFGGMF